MFFIISCYTQALDCYPDNMFQSMTEINFGYVFELGLQFNVALGIALQVNFVLDM